MKLSCEFGLRLLLRVIGTTSLFALLAVVMPYVWMNAIHQALGLGELPSAPIVGYLARTLSAFYALMGGLLWLVSFDLQRHRAVVAYLGFTFVAFGAIAFGVDTVEGLPPYWVWYEGPWVMGFGIATLLLLRGVKPGNGGAAGD